jgi:ABC-2 type transport system permease protein
VLGFMLVGGVEPRLTWLLLPVVALPLLVLTAGVAMLLSALYVRYRDIAPIWSVLSQALFYSSPIFITSETIRRNLSHDLVRAYFFNPIAAVLQQARHWMIGGPDAATVLGGDQWLVVPVAITVLICALGFWVFKREAPKIAEQL